MIIYLSRVQISDFTQNLHGSTLGFHSARQNNNKLSARYRRQNGKLIAYCSGAVFFLQSRAVSPNRRSLKDFYAKDFPINALTL